jgi:hypothetical protein
VSGHFGVDGAVCVRAKIRRKAVDERLGLGLFDRDSGKARARNSVGFPERADVAIYADSRISMKLFAGYTA